MVKKSFWKGFVVGGILCVLSIILIFFNLMDQPDISLSKLKTVDLNENKVEFENYLGKPLVINFWATWCKPCIKEFPHFEKLKQENGEKINFVMISDETNTKIKNFASTNSYSFDFLKSNTDLGEYGINVRPTTYFYNKNGELIKKYTSTLNYETLSNIIEKIK